MPSIQGKDRAIGFSICCLSAAVVVTVAYVTWLWLR